MEEGCINAVHLLIGVLISYPLIYLIIDVIFAIDEDEEYIKKKMECFHKKYKKIIQTLQKGHKKMTKNELLKNQWEYNFMDLDIPNENFASIAKEWEISSRFPNIVSLKKFILFLWKYYYREIVNKHKYRIPLYMIQYYFVEYIIKSFNNENYFKHVFGKNVNKEEMHNYLENNYNKHTLMFCDEPYFIMIENIDIKKKKTLNRMPKLIGIPYIDNYTYFLLHADNAWYFVKATEENFKYVTNLNTGNSAWFETEDIKNINSFVKTISYYKAPPYICFVNTPDEIINFQHNAQELGNKDFENDKVLYYGTGILINEKLNDYHYSYIVEHYLPTIYKDLNIKFTTIKDLLREK